MLLTIGLLVAGTAALWYLRPDLRPGWVPEALPMSPSATITMYRWRDANGEWVVSDEPPSADVPFEEVSYRLDTNTLPALEDG